jgi:ATP-dependent DNA helicase RecQ
VCVVPLPAPGMTANRVLAEHIAHKGRLPLHDVFSWRGGPAPDDTASTPLVAHLESAIFMSPDAALPAGPVLLVTSTVRTRWAATVAAALLREHGAPQVLVLALHLQP